MLNRIRQYTRKLLTIIIILLFGTSLWQLASAGWIQSKAILAQQLLGYSWQQTLNDKSMHRPWPWADTWPVAKLLVPDYGIEQIVLAGDSGHSLAFGPGWSFSGAAINTPGTTVISAHRDTHFRFLKHVNINDTLQLQTRGTTITYRVYDFQVVDSRNFTLMVNNDDTILLLVTCYPFDAVSSGGFLRYLVYARPVLTGNRSQISKQKEQSFVST